MLHGYFDIVANGKSVTATSDFKVELAISELINLIVNCHKKSDLFYLSQYLVSAVHIHNYSISICICKRACAMFPLYLSLSLDGEGRNNE